ncbi:type II toxin-antitoxin system RelE/ParE family toxin [Rhizobium sp.]
MTYELLPTEVYEAWFKKLRDEIARAAVVARLARIEAGNFGDARPVGNGISELRIHYGPGYRIYFQKRGNRIILLLCAGDKSSQQRDVERAKTIANEWTDDD